MYSASRDTIDNPLTHLLYTKRPRKDGDEDVEAWCIIRQLRPYFFLALHWRQYYLHDPRKIAWY